MGHTVGHSLSESFEYNFVPFGGRRTPVELHIEKSLGKLENIADIVSGTKYHPNNDKNTRRESADHLIGYLNSQLEWDDGKRFSDKQKVRYDNALEKLAQAYKEE